MEPLPGVFDMLQYFETILPLVESLWASWQVEVYFMGSGAAGDMYFHAKLTWLSASYDVISRNRGNWPSLNVSQNLCEGGTISLWKRGFTLSDGVFKSSKTFTPGSTSPCCKKRTEKQARKSRAQLPRQEYHMENCRCTRRTLNKSLIGTLPHLRLHLLLEFVETGNSLHAIGQ